ncbi:helix-turn-helix transcriptional regulator [Paracoccus cavernae]|uniref:helix-turn-helix transcriptional regulator n=1 Tax=Paracoccus cavernae TaxID=1571207 RepID=UPI0035F4DBE4
MALSRNSGDDLIEHLRAEPLPAGLRARQLRPCRGMYEGYVHLVLLGSGSLRLEGGETEHLTTAPVGLILPPSSQQVLTLDAGSEGWILGLPPQLLGEVMGSRAEMEMMLPLGRQLILGQDPAAGTGFDCEQFARAILQEREMGAVGNRIAILAYFRLLIIAIWRASHQEIAVSGFGSEAHLLENFRREVEIHFRSHLGIADYAERLGLSTSRLRRICLRNLGRTPLQLVHMRMLREAAAWLEHSGRGIAEIAQALGFADSAEFSHFFKRNTGVSPSGFRAERKDPASAHSAEPTGFADWP